MTARGRVRDGIQRHASAVCLLAVACAVGVLMSGCRSAAESPPPTTRALERLRTLAAEPTSDTVFEIGPARDAGSPPREGSGGLASLDLPEGVAGVTPHSTFAEVVSAWPIGAGRVSADAGPTDGEPDSALVLYAEARQRSIAGDHTRAIRLLEEAAELRPGVPEVWRALADARRAAGFENSSGAAYAQAAELGITEPEALTLAGLHNRARNDQHAAAAALMRAFTVPIPHADPLVRDVAAVALGETLLDLGLTRAGCEVLGQGLDIPPAARVPTHLGVEAVAIRRRLGALSTRLGDGWTEIGDARAAVSWYQRALRAPDGASHAVRTKLISALRRVGRPEAAALMLIEDLDAGAVLDASARDALAQVASEISPRTLVADAVLGLDDRGSETRATSLILARAAALPSRQGHTLLFRALTAPDAPATNRSKRRLFSALIGTVGDATGPDDAVGVLARTVGADTSLARPAVLGLLESDAEPGTLADRLDEIRDRRARWAMRAQLAMVLDDPGMMASMLGMPSESDPSGMLATKTQLAAELGRFDAVRSSLSLLRDRFAAADASARAPATRVLIDALETAQRFTEALPLARALLDDDSATTDDILRAAALEGLSGDHAEARRMLDLARGRDPLDTRIYAAQLAFHSPNGPGPDADRINETGRQLRANAPGSPLLRRLIAGEMLRRGMLDEAAARLRNLFDESPTSPQTLEAMLGLWHRLAAADRAGEIEIDRVRAVIRTHPGAAEPVRLLAGGLVLLGKPADAIEAVESYRARTGSRTLARLREQIIADAIGEPDRAERLALDRLGPSPRGINSSIELAGVHAARLGGRPEQDDRLSLVADALQAIPGDAELTLVQKSTLNTIVTAVATHLQTRRDAEPDPESTSAIGRAGLDLFEWCAARGLSFSPGVHALRLTLLVEQRAPMAAIAGAADHAIAAYEQSRRAFARRLVELLVAASRADDAADWISGLAFDDEGQPDSSLISEWANLVVLTADPTRGRAFIDAMIDHDAVLEVWSALLPQSGGLRERDGTNPAELAYLLAQYVRGTADREASHRFLWLALEYDPDHPWSCNDLGYTMLEEGGSVREAERLIEAAFRGLPDEASIIDSLGWVRYHLGKLEDRVDPATGEPEPGAVTLLRRAADLLGDEDDGVVTDHLGDALFAAGNTGDALDAWNLAARRANRALSRLRAAGAVGGVRFRQIQQLATASAMKRNAVQLNQAPEIEPQRGLTQTEEASEP